MPLLIDTRTINTLKILGLNENEIILYTAALKISPATVKQIAEKAKIKRASSYPYINSLKQKGLLGESREGKRTLLIAEKPEKLFNVLEKKQKELLNIKDSLTMAIKKLEDLPQKKDESNPQIVFYHGVEGIKKIYEDTLTTKTPLLCWYPAQNVQNTLGEFHDNYVKRRVKKGVWAYGILMTDEMELLIRIDVSAI
jgi:sugar-specific transcriptional regulator TrmB